MQHFTGVGVRVGRGEERNDASKALWSHVSVETGVVAKRSSLWLLSRVGEGWWDQGTVLAPVDGNRQTKGEEAHECSSPMPTGRWEHGNGVCKASTFFLGEIAFALFSHSAWALGRIFYFQGLLEAPSKGLSCGHEGVGCSPTGAQWANKR